MTKSLDRHRTDHKFDHKQYKRTHSSCAEVRELELRRSGTYPCGWFSPSTVVGVHISVTELILEPTAGLEETVWSELLDAMCGSGRGNGRNHE